MRGTIAAWARVACLVGVGILTAFSATSSEAQRPKPKPYRNPTVGSAVALQLRDMHRARVRRNVVYARRDSLMLRLDVYRPRTAAPSTRLPAVLLGGPPDAGAGRNSGHKVGWSQLVSASGLAAVAFDIRSDNFAATPAEPTADVDAALKFIKAKGAMLGIDSTRLCTAGFSLGSAPWTLSAVMREPDQAVRCNVVFYGQLDFEAERFGLDPTAAEPYTALTYLRRDGARIAPMLIVKAGRDQFAPINASIDRFVTQAKSVGAPVELVVHPTGRHGLDLGVGNRRTRAVMRRALAFLRTHLPA